MTIRVLTVIPRYWPAMGGAEQHSRALMHHLKDKVDFEVATFCSGQVVPTDYAYAFTSTNTNDDNGIPVHQLSARGLTRASLQLMGQMGKKNRIAAAAFRQAVKPPLKASLLRLAREADIVHAVYNGFTPAAQIAAELGKPFVWTPLAHTSLPDKTGWSSDQFRKLYRKADAIIAMTPYEKNWLSERGADPTKTTIAPMAPLLEEVESDAAAFRRKHKIDQKNMVLFLGRVTEAKGAHLLIQAARQIWSTHPDTAIVLAGPIDYDVVGKWYPDDESRLKICGALGEADKQAALKACDVLCVPSAEESLGVVYLEAWCFEKPVIAADIPVLRTVISHNKDGVLVDRNPAQIATAIESVLANPAHAKEMGRCGKVKTIERYNWRTTANKLSQVYESLMQKEDAPVR